MQTRKRLVRFAGGSASMAVPVLLAALVATVPSCDDGLEADGAETARDDADLGAGPAYGVPPVLDEGHPGFSKPSCDHCHALPVAGHTATDPFICAQCHGANGACEPNGFNDEYNDHAIDEDCGGCHDGGNHGFSDARVCANCHFREIGQRPCVPPDAPLPPGDIPPVGTAPALSRDLVDGCYGFPDEPFSQSNHVPDTEAFSPRLRPGDLAVDFTLRDTAGAAHTLSELLADRPVWLQTGSYTCPLYQSTVTQALNPLATGGNARGAYADQIRIVHVYIVEAHPIWSDGCHVGQAGCDFSPYGKTTQFPDVSIFGQPVTYEERAENARAMLPRLAGEQLLLVDDLSPSTSHDPVWCTYATCPSCSFLIGRDGRIASVVVGNAPEADDLEALERDVLDPFLDAQAAALDP